MRTEPLAHVKAHLSSVVDEVSGTHERVTITRNGRPEAVIVSAADLESLLETLDILADPHARDALEDAEADVAAGRVHDIDDVAAEFAQRRR